MKIRTILAAAAAPAALAAVVLGTAGQASAAVTTAPPVSAYYWQPNGHALGGPKSGNDVSFASGYLAKVTEKMNNADIRGQYITITGHWDQGTGTLADQPNGGDPQPPALPDPTARVFFQGGSGGVTTGSPDGFMGQSWWANWGNPAVVHLNSQTSEFTVTIQVDPSQFSDWNGEQGANSPALFNDTASHVRQIGLSFGGGDFFENGVTGQGGITIDGITVSPTNPAS
jgi:hypothetical protein